MSGIKLDISNLCHASVRRTKTALIEVVTILPLFQSGVVFMLKFKHLIYILVLISVTACKTSPAEDGEPTSLLVPTPNSQDITIETAETEPETESEPLVVSSASTESESSGSGSSYNVQPGEFNLYPRETSGWDETGWSIMTPSEDSRLIYVSSSAGDDETAEFYALRDVANVANPGLIKPFKTIAAANLSAREGLPDWIILRQGDVWELNELVRLKSGRSVTERSVITSYGQNGSRPIIKANANAAFRIWSNRYYIAVSGIEFYAHKRDPACRRIQRLGRNVGVNRYTRSTLPKKPQWGPYY